jgi:N-acetylmuramoyl-L-alanine amidase
MKRNIKYIVVHCTATVTTATIEAIKNYWKHQLGWTHNGYHYILLRDGTIENITDVVEIANGVEGYNSSSIHLSYIGGIDEKESQKTTEPKHKKKPCLTSSWNFHIVIPMLKLKGIEISQMYTKIVLHLT